MANPTSHDSILADGSGNGLLADRQSNVADVATLTTVGSNTGTGGAGLTLIGDTTAVDQASNLMNDLVALREDLAAIKTTVDAALDVLEEHGLMTAS